MLKKIQNDLTGGIFYSNRPLKKVKNSTAINNTVKTEKGEIIAFFSPKKRKIYIMDKYFKRFRPKCIETFECNFFVII